MCSATKSNDFLFIKDKNYDKYLIGNIIVKKTTKSLLEELNKISSHRDNEAFIESRATHLINSAIYLLENIRKTYDVEQADELERRLLNSIKSSDPNKFVRGIRKLRDAKETKTIKGI
ncbi:MAG: hypothetical protein EBV10_01010 [Synechococcaceae bacterium WB6_1A_059]|nr:hypothetical protein [Synechococcaceae bacterium WB6_1A_059]